VYHLSLPWVELCLVVVVVVVLWLLMDEEVDDVLEDLRR